MEKEDNDIFSLSDIIYIIKRRFYIIFILICIPVIITLYYNKYLVKPTYYGRASIIIGSNDNSKDRQVNLSVLSGYENLLKTLTAILKTNNVAESTIEKSGLNMSTPMLLNEINASDRADTQIIDISVADRNKEQAYKLITTLSDVYIAKIKELYPTVNVELFDTIQQPEYSIETNKSTNLLIAIFIGLILSIMATNLMEYLDFSLKNEKEIKKHLNLPVIGLIPNERNFNKTNNVFKLNSSLIEAFGIFKSNIDNLCLDKNIKALAVVGCKDGEGKTSITSMLAILNAQLGKKTIVIDCNFRNPSIHKFFNLSNKKGIFDYLRKDVELSTLIRKDSVVQNLDVLTTGIIPNNFLQLISSPKMKELVHNLKENYDYILFDTSPIGIFTETQIISQLSDGALMVILSEKTDRKVALKAKELLEFSNCKVVGVCLNKIYKSYLYNDKVYGGKSQNKKVFIINNKTSNNNI